MRQIKVAIGMILNQRSEVLITQRSSDVHMPNMFEFPGGKFKLGETPEKALMRELYEEVGVVPIAPVLFDRSGHQFSDRYVLLWFWLIRKWEGKPLAKESQRIHWIKLSSIDVLKFPPANSLVIKKLAALV